MSAAIFAYKRCSLRTTLNTGGVPERSAGTAPYEIGFDTIIRKLIQIALIKQEPNVKIRVTRRIEHRLYAKIAADIRTQS
jgi:hypothetical protein